jgi:hypothetical protein
MQFNNAADEQVLTGESYAGFYASTWREGSGTRQDE